MKKLFLVYLMMLAGSAWAEWVMYDLTDTNTFYYDPATIKKDGRIRRVWELNDLRKRHNEGEMSRRYRVEYDCKQERSRYLGLSTHSEPMAGGTILVMEGESNWMEVPAGTVANTMLKIVCAK